MNYVSSTTSSSSPSVIAVTIVDIRYHTYALFSQLVSQRLLRRSRAVLSKGRARCVRSRLLLVLCSCLAHASVATNSPQQTPPEMFDQQQPAQLRPAATSSRRSLKAAQMSYGRPVQRATMALGTTVALTYQNVSPGSLVCSCKKLS